MLSDSRIENVHDILVEGLRRFFGQAGMKKAVLGLSGGIDSAVVAALAVRALGKENVTGVLMPSPFSTLHSVNDSIELANNLGIETFIVAIDKIYERVIKETEPFFHGDFHWDTTQENIQARIRSIILMTYSNRNSALLLNTSNKSELSMGYGTLYGDLSGALMVIADLYKLEVYELAEYINCDREVIPVSIIRKAPSAELHEGQKDSDSLPEYHQLDPILYSLNELGKTREQILQEGKDGKLLDRILTLRERAAFKGHQLPPFLKVSTKPVLHESKAIGPYKPF